MSDAGQIDFAALARRAQQMQGAVANAQEDLQAVEATGYGADGMVAATVSGQGRVVGLRIDPSVIDPDDPETLADRILTAIDSAHQTIAEQRAELMSDVTGGLAGILDGLHNPNAGPTVVPRVPNRRRP